MALLDEKTFLSFNKQDMYKIYIDISKKLREKDTFIEKIMTQLAEKFLVNKMVSCLDNREHAMIEVAIQTDNNEQVRDFQKISQSSFQSSAWRSIIEKLATISIVALIQWWNCSFLWVSSIRSRRQYAIEATIENCKSSI